MPNSSPSWNRPGWVLRGDYSTGLVGPDGRGLALRQDMADAARRLTRSPGDGQALRTWRMFGEDAALTFGLLGKNPTAGICSSCCTANGASAGWTA